jgi:hypothetical protein
MKAEFATITISGCNESKVRRASGNKAHYVLPFSLSAKPPREWEDIFDDVWRSERKRLMNPKAEAYLRKGELILECALGDIEADFGVLRSSVDAANEKYTTHLKHKAEKNEKKRLKREEEELATRQAIHEVIQRLQFS